MVAQHGRALSVWASAGIYRVLSPVSPMALTAGRALLWEFQISSRIWLGHSENNRALEILVLPRLETMDLAAFEWGLREKQL